ncbi:hypothetical protein FGADI_10489 [Fusarium gaditjirri]|uniref:Uncharacterized protein n=1 Tax=Fusarium gaditjirri TaxID=282569 RepID=A0A8H4SXJ5_9HYPO|nr:hypothetical protein FGADI_10489 [Fusarium gaditjirri]
MTDTFNRLHFSSSKELVTGPSIIPESELKDIEPRNLPGSVGLYLLKLSSATGFTLGRSNTIQSVVRYVNKDVGEVISREGCIVRLDKKAFSGNRDSGACVFDLEGRVDGMITAGLEPGDKAGDKAKAKDYDVTYAAPMEWLLDDIKRQGYAVMLPN